MTEAAVRPRRLAPSLKRLLAGHELALLVLVSMTALFGALALYFTGVHTDASQQAADLRLQIQQFDARVKESLREATDAAATFDDQGPDRWHQRRDALAAELLALRDRALLVDLEQLVQPLSESFVAIAEDADGLFRGAPLVRESQRVRLQGMIYRGALLAGFDAAVKALDQALERRQIELADQLARRVSGLLLLMPLPLLIAFALALRARRALDREVLAPVRALADAAGAFGSNQLGRPVAEQGAREIRDLGQAFNAMRQALQDSRAAMLSQERQAALGALVPVVAHNIRNPLASIRANAQLLDAQADAEDVVESRQAIMQTVDRLERWVSSLLLYLGPMRPRMERLDLAAILGDLRELLTHLLREKQIDLEMATDGMRSASLLGDPALAEQLLHGLLLNAIEAAPAGSRVSLAWHAGESALTISNAGAGADFKPQARPDLTPGPTTKARGTGLGIPFAFKVCEAHGWQLEFAAVAPDGIRARIRFQALAMETENE